MGWELADKLIANAVYGHDVPRLIGHGLNLMAQTRNKVINRSCSRVVVIAPDIVEQLVAGPAVTLLSRRPVARKPRGYIAGGLTEVSAIPDRETRPEASSSRWVATPTVA